MDVDPATNNRIAHLEHQVRVLHDRCTRLLIELNATKGKLESLAGPQNKEDMTHWFATEQCIACGIVMDFEQESISHHFHSRHMMGYNGPKSIWQPAGVMSLPREERHRLPERHVMREWENADWFWIDLTDDEDEDQAPGVRNTWIGNPH